MRTSTWCALGAVLLLGAASPAWAQRTFGGIDPLKLIFQPVDPSNSVVPIARPQKLAAPQFSLANILPRVGLPGNQPVHGRSIFPSREAMPGANYLRQFHFQRPQPVR
jgi:hypothetical protein